MARTKNATQVKPTAGEVAKVWRDLKLQAAKGNTVAMIGLLALVNKQKEFE